jgi:hypothetical protein
VGGNAVRLADYVVSYSLQINNRCLRYLAECDARGAGPTESNDLVAGESHTVYAESLLARDSRRLVSMWVLMQPAWKNGDSNLAEHVAALDQGARLLTEASSSRRLALRLANLASEDNEAQAILRVARSLPAEVPMTWDELNDLFARDSHFWRKSSSFRILQDDVLHQRVVRSYRKAYRLVTLLPEHESGVWLDAHGANLHLWVQRAAHQMELLRPGLSDKAKAQLWYLDKTSDTLRTRAGLLKLREATASVDVKKSAVKLVTQYIELQIEKMDKRMVRLVKGSFSSKPKKMSTMTQVAVNALGLRRVSLMKNPALLDDADKLHPQAS